MTPPIIYLGTDHAGFRLKEKVEAWLLDQGYCVEDLSPKYVAGDDYPKIGFKVAKAVARNKNALGVLLCGSSIGVAIAANRIKGARAAPVHSPGEAKLAREHNDANIITLAGWKMGASKATQLLRVFLKTPFSRATRHHRRVKQLG